MLTLGSRNFDLTKYPHVHFVGIAGIGMSALARLLLARGHTISGSDRSPGEQGPGLQQLGAIVHSGHNGTNLDGADLVVVTAAVKDDNVEVRAAGELGIPVVKRSELLAAIANAGFCVAVAGTHGKTTTSALVSFILTSAQRDPTALLGGVSKDLGSNARVGSSDLVVVEADEYDATFLRLRPQIGVITNVAAEHLDYFGTAENVYSAFREFAEGVSDTLVICSDDPMLTQLVAGVTARVITYGLESGEWRGSETREERGRLRFAATHGSEAYQFSTQLAGVHNARNILAAAAVCDALGVPQEQIREAVEQFSGVGRRFDVKGESAGVLVLDDYAVHPAEVCATLAAVEARFQRPIRVVFQPHTYSRTRDFLDDFALSFGKAHVVYVMDIYAARETDNLGISGSDLAREVAHHHPQVHYTLDAETTLKRVLCDVDPGDVVVTMGAGDVTGLGPTMLERLSTR